MIKGIFEDVVINFCAVRIESVCCYFRSSGKDWVVQNVQQIFHTNDTRLILQTRIPQNMTNDKIIWIDSNT